MKAALAARSVTAGLIGVLLAACVTTTQVQLNNFFDEVETRNRLQPGNNSISGSALLRKAGGDVVTCAGGEVDIWPATEYARERFNHLYGSEVKGFQRVGLFQKSAKFDQDPPGYISSVKKTVCDAQGFFKFNGLSDGDWYIATLISWRISEYNWQGGRIGQLVTVAGGRTTEVVLTY